MEGKFATEPEHIQSIAFVVGFNITNYGVKEFIAYAPVN